MLYGDSADFIHPAEAAHGDLGLVGANDVIAFSTSGKSREVLEILEMSRHLGVDKIIGVTSHLDSELRQHSDLILDKGTISEPCPLGLTQCLYGRHASHQRPWPYRCWNKRRDPRGLWFTPSWRLFGPRCPR